MKLHENPSLFSDSINQAAINLKMPVDFVLKDYWLCLILKTLSESIHKNYVIFKGGTSLSKVHSIIDRFSEDIDLSVTKEFSQKKYIYNSPGKSLHKIIKDIVPPSQFIKVKDDSLSKKSIYKRVFRYKQHAVNAIAPSTLVLELNSFSNPAPCSSKLISSYVSNFLNESDTPAKELISKFQLEPFEVLALDVEKTLCEKILAINRCHQYLLSGDSQFFKARVRHLYDICQILNIDKYSKFLESDKFIPMLKESLEDDVINKNMIGDIDKLCENESIFVNPGPYLDVVKTDYLSGLKNMVISGKIPPIEVVASKLNSIGKVIFSNS